MEVISVCLIGSGRTAIYNRKEDIVMVKSMFAAVAGLTAHQSRMDVIGNNIANVNTWGYKAASMSFKDTMYSTSGAGSGGGTEDGNYGGTNANQIGYGVTTGAISYDFATGGMAPSASSLDCMIDGAGFFLVGPMNSDGIALDTDNAVKSSNLKLTRVGEFQIDANGYLTDKSGNYVYGFKNNGKLTDSNKFEKSMLVPLKIPTTADMADVKTASASDSVAAAQTAYDKAVADLKAFQLAYTAAKQDYMVAKKNYDDEYTTANIDTKKSAVDTAKEAMDKAYKDWKEDTADPALKTAYDTAAMDYEKAKYALARAEASVQAPTALGGYSTVDLDAAINNYVTAYNQYSTSGLPADKTDMENKQKTLEDIETALSVVEEDSALGKLNSAKSAVDQAKVKAEAMENTVTEKKNSLDKAKEAATSTASKITDADDTLSKPTSYKIQDDGTVTAKIDGSLVTLGKIALAGVQNTAGLEKTSGYFYSLGANVGNVGVYEAGSQEAGNIKGNYLEQATVNLATEMSNMITTQRGFQANSKIITVTDTMLEELVNMKR
jgi:flagellar hook protein FlgE